MKAASLHPDGRLIASAGNDCALRVRSDALPRGREGMHPTKARSVPLTAGAPAQVFDVRTSGAACSIEEAHPLAINGTGWRPGSEHIVLSSGFDPALRVHDLRRPSEPLHLLRGHVAPGQSRCKGINRPAVVAGPAGPTVLTGGSKSEFLSVYCMDTGAVLSRGHVGFEPSSLLAGPAQPPSLVAGGYPAALARRAPLAPPQRPLLTHTHTHTGSNAQPRTAAWWSSSTPGGALRRRLEGPRGPTPHGTPKA